MKLANLTALLCAALWSQPLAAGEITSSAGIATGTAKNEVTMLGENHMLIKSNTSYENFEMDDPNHPFAMASGECFGSFEFRPPAASGGGNCVFTDADGDISANKFVVTGLAENGSTVGTWTLVGGTGKFAGSSGGGTFQSLTDQQTGKFTNTIDGAMSLK